MTGLPLLTILIAIPMVAALLCLFVKAKGARWAALLGTLLTLALSAWLWIAFDPNGAQWQFVEKVPIGGGVSWALGIDGIANTGSSAPDA